MKKIPFKSIRSKFAFWFVILGLTPLFVGVLITYCQQVHLIKKESFDQLVAIRDSKVHELENWLDEKEAGMKSVSGHKYFRELEQFFQKEALDQSDERVIDNMRRILNRDLVIFDDFFELFIINKYSGKVIVSTNKDNEGMNESQYPSLIEFLAIEDFHIKDIHLCNLNNEPEMVFAIPIRCLQHQGQHIIGILVGRIHLEKSLYSLLLNRIGLGNTGEALIVSKDLWALNELRWHKNASLKFRINTVPAINASQGKTGILETIDYRGENVLAAYTYIPQTKWGFIVKQDLTVLYAPIKSMMIHFIILIAGSLVVILAIVFFMARTIANPVIAMAATAKKMQKGDLFARNHLTGSDELAILSNTFNEMADSIESHEQLRQINDEITQTIINAKDLSTFRTTILQTLIKMSGSQMGAYFTLNRESNTFTPVTSIGIIPELLKPFDAAAREGELGMVVETKKITHLNNIPKDSIFRFRTFAGTMLPKAIISIPVIIDNVVSAIVSLASIKPYPKKVFEIMKEPWTTEFGTALSHMWANDKTARLAVDLEEANNVLQAQSEELQSQTEELRQNAEELQEQNRALETQKQQVEAANRLKSEFLSNMSHELRTPLNSIMALSRVLLMQSGKKLSEEEMNYLEIIERSGKNLLSLINDILDLSKIEAGRMDVRPKIFSVSSTLDTIMERLAPIAEDKKIKLDYEIFEKTMQIESDEARVHQILQNLIGNAVKFTEQGEVKVSAHCDDENIHIAVSDTGIGISEKDLPLIFEEFRQVDGTSARRYEGTGLGLTLAHRATGMLGGNLSVKSTLDKGSVFFLTLPVRWQGGFPVSEFPVPRSVMGNEPAQKSVLLEEINKNPAGIENFGKNVKAGRGNKTDRILLIEDNEASVIQVKGILEHAGYIVDVARGGEEALDYMSRFIPCGIILDLMMPKVDGFEVLEKMRGSEAAATVPVLILTARDLTPEDLGKLSASNIRQLAQKGDVDRESLLFKVRSMLGSKPEGGLGTGELGSGTGDSGFETQKYEHSAENGNFKLETSKSAAGQRKNIVDKPVKATAGNPATILVVEDNPDNMTTIKAVLQNKYNIYEATDGEEGLKKIFSIRPDLVLLDMSLPKMDGFTVAGKVKNDKKIGLIPIIALTARAMRSDREQIEKAGCDDFIAKPIDPEKVLAKIEKWVSGTG